MNWLGLSLSAAAAKATGQVLTKALLGRRYGVFETTALTQFAAAMVVIPLAFIPEAVRIPTTAPFHLAAWVSISLNAVGLLLLTEAMRISRLSYALPFLAVTPVFTLLTARLIRGEAVTAIGAAGVAVVAAGALGMDASSLPDWLSMGGRRVLKDKGVGLVLAVSMIYAFSSVYDKTATLLAGPLTYVWYSTVFRAILLIFLFAAWRPSAVRAARADWAAARWNWLIFVAAGAGYVLESLFQMLALGLGAVAYVIAVKRLSIAMTSLAGFFFFAERCNRFRIAATLLMILGAALLAVS